MASTITAGNATNGTVVLGDNTGILQLKTGTGAGTAALTLDASQNATFAGTVTASGVITSPTGVLYPLVSGTAITLTNQTAPDFTGIPSTAKRVTLIFNEVSTNGTSNILIQLGTGSTPTYTTSGYVSTYFGVSGTTAQTGNSTSGIVVFNAAISYVTSGFIQFVNVSGDTWIASGAYKNNINTGNTSAGSIALGAALTAVRLFIDGTQQFDAGTINIMWE